MIGLAALAVLGLHLAGQMRPPHTQLALRTPPALMVGQEDVQECLLQWEEDEANGFEVLMLSPLSPPS